MNIRSSPLFLISPARYRPGAQSISGLVHASTTHRQGFTMLASFGAALVYLYYALSAFTNESAALWRAFLFLCWLCTAVVANPSGFPLLFRASQYRWLIGFVATLLVLFVAAGMPPLLWLKRITALALLFSPLLMFDFYRTSGQSRLLAGLFAGVMAIYAMLCIRTLYWVNQMPRVTRWMAYATKSSHADELGQLGLGGGYSLAYALCLLVPVLIFALREPTRIVVPVRMAFLGLLTLASFTLVRADYTLALLFAVGGGMVACLLSGNRKHDVAILIGLFVLGLAFCLIEQPGVVSALEIAADTFAGTTVEHRLMELQAALSAPPGSATAALERQSLYWRTMGAFLDNPLFGVGVRYQFDFQLGKEFVGGHTEWLDTLAVYGLLGAIPYMATYYLSYRSAAAVPAGGRYPAMILLVYVLLTALGFVNPVGTMVIFTIPFLVVPCYPYFCRHIGCPSRTDPGGCP